MDHPYPVVLAHPSEMKQYDGIKAADDLTDAAFLARLARLHVLPTGYIYPRQDRPVRDLLRRRTLLVQQRTGIILSLQNLAMRQAGRSIGWRDIRKLGVAGRRELPGDHDCLTFVAEQQIDLIGQLSEKIGRFEKKVLEHAQLKPAYECLLTMPGVGVILALTSMLETGEIGRFETVGDYTSYCRCVRATHTSNGKCKDKNNSRNGNAYLVPTRSGWDRPLVLRHEGSRSRSGWMTARKRRLDRQADSNRCCNELRRSEKGRWGWDISTGGCHAAKQNAAKENRNIAGFMGVDFFGSGRVFLYLTKTQYG